MANSSSAKIRSHDQSPSSPPAIPSRKRTHISRNSRKGHTWHGESDNIVTDTFITPPAAWKRRRRPVVKMLSSLLPLPQLPKYRGPYNVGSCEYEIGISELPSSTRVPDAALTTIKFRVFYPTSPDATSKQSIPWLPQPQKEWNRAYGKFLGLSDRSSSVMANIPSMLNWPELPAVQNAPLLDHPKGEAWPVAVFSHGLGGNQNAYSVFVGSLASCGIVVFAPEHRDASCPVSFIRESRDKIVRPVFYRRLSHKPSVEVLNARNAMLRVRLWELELLYTAISGLQTGRHYANFSDTASAAMPEFSNTLNLAPSKVSWLGHSFGAATMVQFVKSIYYRHETPGEELLPKNDPDGWDWTPLYVCPTDNELTRQITVDSPMALLDVWTMPLTAKTTKWLWERPLPCYARQPAAPENDRPSTPNVVSVMSSQFHQWLPMINTTKALLSTNPVRTYDRLRMQYGDALGAEPTAMDPPPQKPLDPISKLEQSKVSGAALKMDAGSGQDNALSDVQSEETSEAAASYSWLPRLSTSLDRAKDAPSVSSTRSPSPALSVTSPDLTDATDAASTISNASSMTSVDSVSPTLPESLASKLASKSVATAQLSAPAPVTAAISSPVAETTASFAPLAVQTYGQASIEPHLYLVPSSAHLSQSDFGLLFPMLTKYLLKAQDPDKTMELNVRAVLAMIRGQGIDVELYPFEEAAAVARTQLRDGNLTATAKSKEGTRWWSWVGNQKSVELAADAVVQDKRVDRILIEGAMRGERWERIALQ